MAQVTVTLLGRTYRLDCAEGAETRVIEIAEEVRLRAEALTDEFGAIGDDRILLLLAIMLADELKAVRETVDPRQLPPASVHRLRRATRQKAAH